MSVRHPIIAVTGSSGAGTTTVMKTFDHIFRREQHQGPGDRGRFVSRLQPGRDARARARGGHGQGSDHQPFRTGVEPVGRARRHDGSLRRHRRRQGAPLHPRRRGSASSSSGEPGTFTTGSRCRRTATCSSTKGCMAATRTARWMSREKVDLLVGVVPIINLEWIQKLHRDQQHARLQPGGRGRDHPAAHAGLREVHLPAVQPHARQLPARAHRRYQQPVHRARHPVGGRIDRRDPLRQSQGHRLPLSACRCCTTRG